MKNPVFLENILSKGIGKYAGESVIQNWLKNPTLLKSTLQGFEEEMLLLAEGNVQDGQSTILAYRNTLLMCLASTDLQGNQ